MTEIPEHLLKRSQARKAGGDAPAPGAAAATPPVARQSALPAVTSPQAAAVPPAAKPDIPVVAAYKARKKIPVWAMITLSILPLWVFMYVIAIKPAPVKASGPLGTGAGVYSKNCVGCHQAGGAGVPGGAYSFTEGSAMKTFPHIEDQLRWVSLGTQAYTDAGIKIAGDPNREGGPHVAGTNGLMPSQKGQQTEAEILGAVCDERYALGGVAQDGEEFALWCAADSPVYAALASGAANFDDLHTVIADKGILEIGSVPKEGTTAG